MNEFERAECPKALQYYNKMVHAESEEDLDFLIKILRPSDDRKEMGEVYVDALGYNPITHFDKAELKKIYRDIVSEAPDSLKSELIERQDDILESTIDYKESVNSDYLYQLVSFEIFEETGWSPAPKLESSIRISNSTSEDIESEEDFDDEEEESSFEDELIV